MWWLLKAMRLNQLLGPTITEQMHMWKQDLYGKPNIPSLTTCRRVQVLFILVVVSNFWNFFNALIRI
jgi:hypothetical protein